MRNLEQLERIDPLPEREAEMIDIPPLVHVVGVKVIVDHELRQLFAAARLVTLRSATRSRAAFPVWASGSDEMLAREAGGAVLERCRVG